MSSLAKMCFAFWVSVPVLLLVIAEVVQVLDEAAGRGEFDPTFGDGLAQTAGIGPTHSA